MKTFSDKCKCGHSFEDHHHGVVVNPSALERQGRSHENIEGLLGEECEHDQYHDKAHCDNPCLCQKYDDVNW